MTEREFIEALAEVPESWTLWGGDMIRCNDGMDCPAVALAKHRGLLPDSATADDVDEALDALGIKGFSRRFRIINAADASSIEGLRKRMLAACGLRAS